VTGGSLAERRRSYATRGRPPFQEGLTVSAQELMKGAFTQILSYFAPGYAPAFDSGEFTKRLINDSLWTTESTKVIPVGSALNPSQMFTNKYMFQAYKDLGVTSPTGLAAGVAKAPTALGKPTAEAATALALLTGGALPPNTGIDPSRRSRLRADNAKRVRRLTKVLSFGVEIYRAVGERFGRSIRGGRSIE
jgi:hypothetical protein